MTVVVSHLYSDDFTATIRIIIFHNFKRQFFSPRHPQKYSYLALDLRKKVNTNELRYAASKVLYFLVWKKIYNKVHDLMENSLNYTIRCLQANS